MGPEMVAGLKEQLTKTTPLGRMGRPEEIAYWAVTLADPMAAWVTGKIFGVDGGMGT
jgi:NAD(P)-dependent dehydrogenase (short-subunit alcohol dehydrogenase family)